MTARSNIKHTVFSEQITNSTFMLIAQLYSWVGVPPQWDVVLVTHTLGSHELLRPAMQYPAIYTQALLVLCSGCLKGY